MPYSNHNIKLYIPLNKQLCKVECVEIFKNCIVLTNKISYEKMQKYSSQWLKEHESFDLQNYQKLLENLSLLSEDPSSILDNHTFLGSDYQPIESILKGINNMTKNQSSKKQKDQQDQIWSGSKDSDDNNRVKKIGTKRNATEEIDLEAIYDPVD